MATKRRTDHDSTREPDAPAVEAAAADDPVSGNNHENHEEPAVKDPAPKGGKSDEKEPPKAEAEQAEPAGAADRRAEELASQLEEANGRHLRLAADFENYKKRIRQEQLDT